MNYKTPHHALFSISVPLLWTPQHPVHKIPSPNCGGFLGGETKFRTHTEQLLRNVFDTSTVIFLGRTRQGEIFYL